MCDARKKTSTVRFLISAVLISAGASSFRAFFCHACGNLISAILNLAEANSENILKIRKIRQTPSKKHEFRKKAMKIEGISSNGCLSGQELEICYKFDKFLAPEGPCSWKNNVPD